MKPGDKIFGSITYVPATESYNAFIKSMASGWSATTNIAVEAGHGPYTSTCRSLSRLLEYPVWHTGLAPCAVLVHVYVCMRVCVYVYTVSCRVVSWRGRKKVFYLPRSCCVALCRVVRACVRVICCVGTRRPTRSAARPPHVTQRCVLAVADVVFVTERQPDDCGQYPANGDIVFEDINVAWEGKVSADPGWSAQQFVPACNCQAVVLSPTSVKFTWDTSASQSATAVKAAAQTLLSVQ